MPTPLEAMNKTRRRARGAGGTGNGACCDRHLRRARRPDQPLDPAQMGRRAELRLHQLAPALALAAIGRPVGMETEHQLGDLARRGIERRVPEQRLKMWRQDHNRLARHRLGDGAAETPQPTGWSGSRRKSRSC